MKKIIKKFETAFVQRGIAPEVGLDQSEKTVVYAALYDDDWDYMPYFYVKGTESDNYLTVVYEVEVTHPEIYAGTVEEFRKTVIRSAKEALRKEGVLKIFNTCAGLEDEFLVKIDV